MEQHDKYYDQHFFDVVNRSALLSCSEVLPRVRQIREIKSVLDVGCGQGGWLNIWQSNGVEDVLGLDGFHINKKMLMISEQNFKAVDLREKVELNRKFDLVECLEVAEHLEAEHAETIVDTIVKHGDVALFSAAYPGDGGVDHVNEQPFEYWRDIFAKHGYDQYDFVRPFIRGNSSVEYWYRYNIFIFINRLIVDQLPSNVLATKIDREKPVPVVTPVTYRLRGEVLKRMHPNFVTKLARFKARLFSMKQRFFN